MQDQRFTKPTHLCDLVMKGGVTSAVVYPLTVCELATVYSFKNIGGTSAGAIAAAAAAAAECGRRDGNKDAKSFTGLASMPDWIGKPGRLEAMFEPDRSTRELFRLAMAGMNPPSVIGKIGSVCGQLLLRYPLTVISLALGILLILYSLWDQLTGISRFYVFGTTLLLAACLFLVRVVMSLYRQLTRNLPANFYGLCRGYDGKSTSNDAPLINWMSRYLNELAGKPLAKGPLTFGDLYRAGGAPGEPEPSSPGSKAINLEMMTTAVTLGRPFRLPFRDPDRIFYFSDTDFRTLFPNSVVDHMVANARVDEGQVPVARGVESLYGFPDAENLPVVVAARMSLSFPVLLSAIPLYAVDFTLEENHKAREEGRPPRADRCWFSDGGICSNLPIHFFDAPLPQWPTFAINLKQFHPDHQEEKDAVWLPQSARSGWLPVWSRFEKSGEFGRVSGFLWAIINTMQNWQDNTQARVPGYRDRLVHVSQRDNEGGLNLNMPEPVIKILADRGRRAGIELIKRFDERDGVKRGWTEHRWVRFRSCMSLTVDWLRHIVASYPRAIAPDAPLPEILRRGPKDPPSAYRLDPSDQALAAKAMDELTSTAKEWSDGKGFQSEPPKPTPELRIKAGI